LLGRAAALTEGEREGENARCSLCLLNTIQTPDDSVSFWAARRFASTCVVMMNATAWKSLGPSGQSLRFPELQQIRGPSTAVAFSGGGTRAFTAAIGQLAALNELGLLKDVRYIAGISGGSWATATFSFAQLGEYGVAEDDAQLLGPIFQPEMLNETTLSEIDELCARRSATTFFEEKEKARRLSPNNVPSEMLPALLHEWFLKRVGIPRGQLFSWNANTTAEIRSRNPWMVNTTFVLPPSGHSRPFPIMGSSLLGPRRLSPLQQRHRGDETVMLEFSPISAGQARTFFNHSYYARNSTRGGSHVASAIGGFVETFAFGSEAPPFGLPSGATEGVLAVPRVDSPFSLEDAMVLSSFFPGMGFSVLGANDKLGISFPYWSPASTHPQSEPYLFGDGGDFENIHLLGLLQRKIRSIVLFFNTVNPLHGAHKWDPTKTPPSNMLIADEIPPFFGVRQRRVEALIAFDYSTLQCFSADDFVPVVQKLQAAQDAGGGIVVTTPLLTVVNEAWGIEAGFEVNVTWVVLSRLGAWEKRLPPKLRAQVQPHTTDPYDDYGELSTNGTFKGFPHYDTTRLMYSAEQANLLAHLTGWGVLNNEEVFRRALAGGVGRGRGAAV
jgi:hypothetical protein